MSSVRFRSSEKEINERSSNSDQVYYPLTNAIGKLISSIPDWALVENSSRDCDLIKKQSSLVYSWVCTLTYLPTMVERHVSCIICRKWRERLLSDGTDETKILRFYFWNKNVLRATNSVMTMATLYDLSELMSWSIFIILHNCIMSVFFFILLTQKST